MPPPPPPAANGIGASLAAAPTVTETEAMQEEQQVEVAHGLGDMEAYLLCYYPPKATDRIPLSEGLVIKEINAMTIELASTEYPLMESGGIRLQSRFGPVTIHGLGLDHMQALSERFHSMAVEGYTDDKMYTSALMDMKIRYIDVKAALGLKQPASDPNSLGPTFKPVRQDYIKTYGGFIEVRLDDEQIAMGVSMADVVKAAEAQNLRVYRRVHVSSKVAVDEGGQDQRK